MAIRAVPSAAPPASVRILDRGGKGDGRDTAVRRDHAVPASERVHALRHRPLLLFLLPVRSTTLAHQSAQLGEEERGRNSFPAGRVRAGNRLGLPSRTGRPSTLLALTSWSGTGVASDPGSRLACPYGGERRPRFCHK